MLPIFSASFVGNKKGYIFGLKGYQSSDYLMPPSNHFETESRCSFIGVIFPPYSCSYSLWNSREPKLLGLCVGLWISLTSGDYIANVHNFLGAIFQKWFALALFLGLKKSNWLKRSHWFPCLGQNENWQSSHF